MKRRYLSIPAPFSLLLMATVGLLTLAVGCSDELTSSPMAEEGYPTAGSEVAFAVSVPGSASASTRAAGDLPAGYGKVSELKELAITMKGNGKSWNALYDVADGECTVAQGSTPLYWQDNVNQYRFTAQWGEETLADVQTEENWAALDLLKGYGAVPTADGESGGFTLSATAEEKTNKEWYSANVTWLGGASAACRTIPIFLQHQRAWITVILKAGEGVTREDLDPTNDPQLIQTRCLSYQSDPATEITPKRGETTVSYTKDANGEAEAARATVKYDAIVEPHDFTTNPGDDKLFTVSVSGQTFLFYASNDNLYKDIATDEGKRTEWESKYNLTAGKHLTITATLSRDSRKVLITAYIEDWEEEVYSFICDDFGGAGKPVVISTRQDLLDFLQDDSKNKAGNVAIVAGQVLDLTMDENGNPYAEEWPDNLVLKSTLNLGGARIILPDRLLQTISSTGSIVSGEIEVTANVNATLCETNEGTISKIDVVPQTSGVSASRAGLAITNHGIITSCNSWLPVTASGTPDTKTYIGGIAAESTNKDELAAVIEGCTVYGCVDIPDGSTNIYGAGIVGLANGTVSSNTYEFGVTLSQSDRQSDGLLLLRNILHTKQDQDGADLTASGNRWPTQVDNTEAGTNVYPPTYNAVISNQEELLLLVKGGSSYNDYGKIYRIACDFEVNTAVYGTATKGDVCTADADYNVLFTLEGNDKCLTLTAGTYHYSYTYTGKTEEGNETTLTEEGDIITAPMLFGNITGKVQNLNIHLQADLLGVPDGKNTDVAAPLAYSVTKGEGQATAGEVTQVHVTAESGVKVSAAGSPSGLVIWGYNGALLTSCSSEVEVELKYPVSLVGGEKRFVGGLLSQADDVTLDRCHFDGKVTCSGTSAASFYLGGLVGSVDVKISENNPIEGDYIPHLTLTDCYSRFQPGKSSCMVGSVLGRSYYQEGSSGTKTHGVVSTACQGNWWYETTTAVGEKTNSDGYTTDEKILGKRNSVQPF